MVYIRRDFYTNNKQIQNYFDKLIQSSTVTIPSSLASEISRHKTIRNIRDMNRNEPYILFGRDEKYHKTIIHIRRPMRIEKKGLNGYRFLFDL